MGRFFFDEDTAARYDSSDGAEFEPEVIARTARFLADEAQGGAALELAIGTGRIAMPLLGLGVAVSGIDISEPMVAKLREKPGADAVDVTIADYTIARLGRTFSLVYLVFNTIGNVLTQDEQVQTFETAAAHLEPGGRFVIEVGIPNLRRLPPGETVRAFTLTPTHLGFDEYDFAEQRAISHHYYLDGNDAAVIAFPFRYVWPSELDLMARIAGMRLHARFADWDRSPYTSESYKHISVWEKPE